MSLVEFSDIKLINCPGSHLSKPSTVKERIPSNIKIQASEIAMEEIGERKIIPTAMPIVPYAIAER